MIAIDECAIVNYRDTLKAKCRRKEKKRKERTIENKSGYTVKILRFHYIPLLTRETYVINVRLEDGETTLRFSFSQSPKNPSKHLLILIYVPFHSKATQIVIQTYELINVISIDSIIISTIVCDWERMRDISYQFCISSQTI